MIYRIGIEAGIVDKDEIISWADSVMTSSEAYIDQIADLSTCSDKPLAAIYSLLGEVPGDRPSPQMLWQELGTFIRRKIESRRLSPERAVSMLDWHCRDGVLPKDVAERVLRFKLDYDCVAEGYGSRDDMDERVTAYFANQAKPMGAG